MGKIISAIIFFCSFSVAKGQNNDQIMVVINQKDSVEYIQKNKTKFLKFYFLDNVKYNSTQKKQILSGGHVLCETCKKESYSVSVIPIKKPSSKLKKIRVNDFLVILDFSSLHLPIQEDFIGISKEGKIKFQHFDMNSKLSSKIENNFLVPFQID